MRPRRARWRSKPASIWSSPGSLAGDDYHAAVARGLLSEHAIDRAVGRILALKFRLGLFEHPFVAEELARKTFFSLRTVHWHCKWPGNRSCCLKNER